MRAWRDHERPWPSCGVVPLVLLVLLALPGCGEVQRLLGRTTAAPSRPAPGATARSSVPLHGEAGQPMQAAAAHPPAPEPEAASVARASPVAPPPPIVLTGMSASELVRLLGQPAARQSTGQGEQWVYRGGDCRVDVFVFPDVARGEPAVLDERVTATAPGQDAAQACLLKLRHDRAL